QRLRGAQGPGPPPGRGAAGPHRRRRGGRPRARLRRARRRRSGGPGPRPPPALRPFGVRLKLSPNRAVIEGKRVVVVDDSIVRGTTSRKIVRMVRDAGAREVHVRISSPPTQWPCYYGIDTPTRRELIASSHSTEEIARYVAADSLGHLSLDGMLETLGGSPNGFCHACFSGQYAIPFTAS